MALDVGTLVGYLKLDVSDVGKQVRKAQDDVRRGLGDLDRDADKAGAKVGTSFSTSLTKGLKSAGAIFGGLFVVDKVVAWFRGAIDAASDANETLNKSTVIFGRNEAAMEAWAKGAVRGLGMTTAGALDAASGFGDMFSQLGFGADQAAAMSRQIVQMAADFGSFNNLGTEDVLERIAAGFRGEYDSLQKLIPNISAARVQQEALAMTGKKSAESLTAQEKAAATLAIVQQDGARAMGDFARTADGAANMQKQTAAAAQELAVKVGNMLLPAYTALVKFGRDQVIPFLSGTVDVIGEAGVVIGPLVSGVGAIASGFRDLPGPIQGAVVGMLAFILLKDRLAAVGTAIKTDVVSALDTVRLKAMYAGDAAAAAGGGFRGMASAIGASAGAGLRGAASGLLGVLGGPWGAAFTGATALVGLWMQKQAEGKARVQALSASLDDQTGAITGNTRALMAKRLLEDGVMDDARKMGLSLDDVTSAALGQADALARVNAQIDDYLAKNLYDAAGQYATDMRKALGGAAADTAEAVRQSTLLTEAVGATGDAAGSAAPKVDRLAGSVSGAAEATMTLKQAQDILAGNIGTLWEAENRYAEAVDATNKAIGETPDKLIKAGQALDANTEAGRRNRDALVDEASAAKDAAESALKHGDSVDTVKARMETARETFIDHIAKLVGSREKAAELATQMGLTSGKVDDLATSIRNTPEGKAIKITVDAELALWRVKQLSDQLALIRDKTVSVTLIQQTKNAVAHGADPQADGSIRFNGVRAMAAGDVTRQATIMRRMAPILWNEAPGGEAYIPLASSKRARSLRIWERTGQLLGATAANAASSPAAAPVDPAALESAVRNGMQGMTVRFDRVSTVGDYVLGVLDSAQSREAVYA